MFIHSVYFWLKDDLTDAARAEFRAGLESLRAIDLAKSVHIGTPADTDRPVVERSYSFALVIALDDQASHDAYQVHPIHTAFAERFKPYWTKITVFDFA